MNFFRKVWLIVKYLGPGWVAFRLRYALRLRSGAMKRRVPVCQWAEVKAAAFLPTWLCTPDFPESGAGWGSQCVAESDGVSLGEFKFFSHETKHLGCPPDWHKNAYTGQRAPRGRHWSELGDFDFGDIKAIWEPSRFGWAFTLARAYARTKESRIADLFWKLFEDWCAKNPPNEGVNWKCGQESTFRLMGATFALAQFARVPGATGEQLQLWSRFVLVTGRRVAANLDYALSQSNNHGVSECVGLITAGLLSTETEETRQWQERGWRNLHIQLDELIYSDGSFSQHSVVYHRVLLHDLYWLISLCRKSATPVPDWLEAKTRLAWEFLANLVDANTGGAPLYGANDGANVLPLDDGAFDDFRGAIQAGAALLNNQRVYSPGPWDESMFWLLGPNGDALPQSPMQLAARWHAPQAGCFQWITGDMRLFLRCPTYFRHRPSQADMLHVDIWWRGRAVALDSGSYSNNMPPPLGGAFSQAKAHNVPMLADHEPLQKAGRFLYLPWPTGTVEFLKDSREFRATHHGYGDAAHVQRKISNIPPNVFSISDTLILPQPARARIHWLLADAEWNLDIAAGTMTTKSFGDVFTITWAANLPAISANIVRADPTTARGWRSRHYLAVEPAVSFELIFDVDKKLEVTTRFSPGRV